MELKSILEAILFSAQHPLTVKDLRELMASAAEKSEEPAPKDFRKVSADQITEALEQLAREQEQLGRSYHLMCVAGAWQFASRPDYAPWIKALVGHKVRAPRLSQPALETLAIIAYRQPLMRAEIEQIRGVAVDGVMQTLLERGLVEQTGRADVPGRPITYGTTQHFLEYFGLGSLEDLPAADELRRIPIQKPETLLTADHPGLATAPPDEISTDQENATEAGRAGPAANEPAPSAPA